MNTDFEINGLQLLLVIALASHLASLKCQKDTNTKNTNSRSSERAVDRERRLFLERMGGVSIGMIAPRFNFTRDGVRLNTWQGKRGAKGTFELWKNPWRKSISIFYQSDDRKYTFYMGASVRNQEIITIPIACLEFELKLEDVISKKGRFFRGLDETAYEENSEVLDKCLRDIQWQRAGLEQVARTRGWNLSFPEQQADDVINAFIARLNAITVGDLTSQEAVDALDAEVIKVFNEFREYFVFLEWALIMKESPFRLTDSDGKKLRAIFIDRNVIRGIECQIVIVNSHTMATSYGAENIYTGNPSDRSFGINVDIINSSANKSQLFDAGQKIFEEIQRVELEHKTVWQAVDVKTKQIVVKEQDFVRNVLNNYGINHLYFTLTQPPDVADAIMQANRLDEDLKKGWKKKRKIKYLKEFDK